ncbi:MAG: hypothetical protein H6546_00850 [Chitinophagales bacterium]|nr:hypothetical protein [Chitinophagales bacterium]
MELDDLLIQGADYAYTIHGWLKGVNSGALNTSRDMGGDAKSTGIRKLMGTDAFGFILHYYDGDYTQIGSGNSFIPTASTSGTGYNLVTENLYNGNIRAMTTALMRETHAKVDVVGAAYTYDQLNRLTGRKTFIKSNMHLSGNFTWSAISESPKWSSAYTYDGNGNLLTLERAGDNATSSYDMDDLTYNYYPNTNQLGRVDDAISSSAYSDDIDDQTGANYSYDEIGNLISDDQGDIDDIQWNVQGKITFIDKGSGPDLTFAYDAMGNRVMKMVDDGTEQVYTYYVRDAQGNIMTTYSRIDNGSTDSIFLGEQHIYGSGRLGYLSTRISMDSVLPTTGYYYRQLGLRRYELSNHLGNVLVVITDRRLLIEGTGGLAGKIVSAEPDVLQANDYYPFGMMMSGRAWEAGSSHRYGFNGKEKDNEIAGNENIYDLGLRSYDTRLARMWKVDPRTNEYPWQTPFAYHRNGPISMLDFLGGGDPSTEVEATEEEGKYKVVGGNLDDGDRGIYVVDESGERTGQKLGESLTMYSFYNADFHDEKEGMKTGWVGTIDMNSTESAEDLGIIIESVITHGISLLDYAFNATDGKKFDFKRDGDPTNNDRDFHHRGSVLSINNGVKIIASSRDIGNFGPGFIVGYYGHPFAVGKTFFQGLEFAKSGHHEGPQSTLAQRMGYDSGRALFLNNRADFNRINKPEPYITPNAKF